MGFYIRLLIDRSVIYSVATVSNSWKLIRKSCPWKCFALQNSWCYYINICYIIIWFAVSCLSCYECGAMNDGASFLGIDGFASCQFFEHDVSFPSSSSQASNKSSFLRQCPESDNCCFSLREHMNLEFWGRKCTQHTCESVRHTSFILWLSINAYSTT